MTTGNNSEPEITQPQSLARSVLTTLATVCVFALSWAAPRFWLFQDSAMMHDDYFMATYDNVYDVFFIKEYRILGGVFPMLCKSVFPGFYGTNIPIYLNALLMGCICAVLYRILVAMKCGSQTAAITTLLFCWHPIIDDISAWNTMGFALTSVLFVLGGFCCGWTGTKRGIALGTVCIWCSLATYQLMIPLPMVLTIMVFFHKGAIDGAWEWKRAFSVAAAMVLALILYLSYVLIMSPMIFGQFDTGAGIKSPSDVFGDRQGLKMQTVNLYLNLFYSLFSHYTGIKRGLSLWYYAPLAIVGLGFVTLAWGVYQKRIRILSAPLLMTCWLVLPFLAIAPLWFIPLYTEWRISIIVLIPQVIVIGSIAATLQQMANGPVCGDRKNHHRDWRHSLVPFALPIVMLAAAVLMLPVTIADCRMRLDDYRHDRQIVESIRTFRESLGSEADMHRVVYVLADRPVLTLTDSDRPLMKANYLINTYSTFSYGKIWAYAMFRWYALDSMSEEDLTINSLTFEPHSVDLKTKRYAELPYVMHYPGKKISVVIGSPQWFTWSVAE